MSIQPNDSTARDFSWGKPDRPAAESGQADLAGSPRTTAPDTAAEHIRTATVDLRKFVSERRYEVGELNTRMARVEDELQQQNGRGKSLAVLGGVVGVNGGFGLPRNGRAFGLGRLMGFDFKGLDDFVKCRQFLQGAQAQVV